MKKIRYLQGGFTLLEIILVLSLLGILTATGMASFFSYSQKQSYNSAISDVEAMLQFAKGRALSRVKPADCGTTSLVAYRVNFTRSSRDYSFSVICGSSTEYVLQSKKLPDKVTFGSTTSTTVSFSAATGVVREAPVTVIIEANGEAKTITVTTAGIISVQ